MIKTPAMESELLSRLSVRIGQAGHYTNTYLSVKASGYKVKSIKPLEYSDALNNGIGILSEFFVFFVGGSLLVIEVIRNENNNNKKKILQDEKNNLKELELLQKLSKIETRISMLEYNNLVNKSYQILFFSNDLLKSQIMNDAKILKDDILTLDEKERLKMEYQITHELDQKKNEKKIINKIKNINIPHSTTSSNPEDSSTINTNEENVNDNIDNNNNNNKTCIINPQLFDPSSIYSLSHKSMLQKANQKTADSMKESMKAQEKIQDKQEQIDKKKNETWMTPMTSWLSNGILR